MPDDDSFSRLVLSLAKLDQTHLLSLQDEIRDRLNPSDGPDEQLTLDMRYFSMLSRGDLAEEILPFSTIQQELSLLDKPRLLIVDALTIFLLNDRDFKRSLPEISAQYRKFQVRIQHSGITEFGFLTLAFSNSDD